MCGHTALTAFRLQLWPFLAQRLIRRAAGRRSCHVRPCGPCHIVGRRSLWPAGSQPLARCFCSTGKRSCPTRRWFSGARRSAVLARLWRALFVQFRLKFGLCAPQDTVINWRCSVAQWRSAAQGRLVVAGWLNAPRRRCHPWPRTQRSCAAASRARPYGVAAARG